MAIATSGIEACFDSLGLRRQARPFWAKGMERDSSSFRGVF
jgi:hypothetical protein